jgi:hypothetical protein
MRLVLAARCCRTCAAVGATACCAAAISAGVGRAVVPPGPPLKLTLVVRLTVTFLL